MAFQWSAEAIPTNRNGEFYFWTFTFKEVLDVIVARRLWSDFLRKLRKLKKRKGMDFRGLRVFELHPGKAFEPGGHGLHVHVVTDCFLMVNQVRAVWKTCLGGRVHVKPIAPNRIGYLAKYLTKSGRPECFKGARMWAACGGFDHVKIKDVLVDSSWTRAYAVLKATVRTVCGKTFQKMRWYDRVRAVDNVLCGLPWYYAMAWKPVFDAAGAEVYVYQENLGGPRFY